MNENEQEAGLAETPGYRYAEVIGNQLFAAGQVPHDNRGELVGVGDPARQARQCLDNLQTLIGVHDFGLPDVRHLTVYVVGEQRNLLVAWDTVTAWFNGDVPPATLLGVHLLGYEDQLVEIDATVVA